MPSKVTFSFNDQSIAAEDRIKLLLPGCQHYGMADVPMFTAGYRELLRHDLAGGKVLEIACGHGDLAVALARALPNTEVIGMDRYPDSGQAIKQANKEGLTNVRYHQGDALRLTDFSDASLDMIYGQATLHHLAHDMLAVRDEPARVLKPKGRLIFIYEPLGHNRIWAMIRAYRIAKARMSDESNVILDHLTVIAERYSSCEVQSFNFFGYPFKSIARFGGPSAVQFIHHTDRALMRRFPGLAPMAANINVIFTK
jgi:SAM-dependent methyltransferase